MSVEYAEIRRYWEPVVEITQIKGDSETHPVLSPDDAFADFETYPYYIQREWTDYVPQPGDYVRSALRTGLSLEASLGVNPYQFGVIGSTDAHTSLPSAEEDNFHGKMATDSIPSRKSGGWSDDARGTFGWGMSASGLAAVWATENTREAIIAAMRRREVYATSGPRIAVRTFAGLNLSSNALEAPSYPANLAEQAVPMGGKFLAQALRINLPWWLKRKPTRRAGIWIVFRWLKGGWMMTVPHRNAFTMWCGQETTDCNQMER